MKKKTIRLISLALAAVMAVSTLVYVSADEQDGLLSELFGTEGSGETALSDSALETETAESSEEDAEKEAASQNDSSEEEISEETEDDILTEDILSGSALETDDLVNLLLSLTSESEDVVILGSCGDDVSYVLYENGQLVISGSGDMDNTAPWSSHIEDIKEIIISDGVTGIGISAFSECYAVESVSIADSVVTIGSMAFSNCSNLPEITIPDSVTTIGARAFEYCESLKSVKLSSSLESIDAAAFYCCYSLPEITLPDGLEAIGSYAFEFCDSLTSIIIPESVTSIGTNVFSYSGLETVYCYEDSAADDESLYPGDVVIIHLGMSSSDVLACGQCGDDIEYILYVNGVLFISGSGAMDDFTYTYDSTDDSFDVSIPWYDVCDEINSVIIFDGITSIGNYAFYECYNMESITIPDSVTSIGKFAFMYCEALPEIDLPDSVSSLGTGVFFSCISLESITLPQSLTVIPKQAFYFCDTLRDVTIPKTTVTIEDKAFQGCLFESIVIPESVTSIGSDVFTYSSLETVYCFEGSAADDESLYPEGVTLVYLTGDYLLFGTDENITYILYTDGSLIISGSGEMPLYSSGYGGYDYCYPWDNYTSQIKTLTVESGITEIADYAFEYCTNLESASISETVESINEGAFENCSSLKEVNIPKAVTTINNYVFENCSSLKNIDIPETVTSIGSYAFCSTALTEIVLPEGLTSLGAGAFYGCKALPEVTLPEGLTSLGTAAFSDCISLEFVNIPETLTEIGNSTFSGCIALKSITIPPTITSIGYSAFEDSGLTTVYCYKNSMADDANLYPEGTELVYTGESEIEVLCSGSCGSDVTYTLYTNGEMIISGTGDMYGYSYNSSPWGSSYRNSIKSVTIEEGVTSIGSYVFYACYTLSSVSIPDTVTSINNYAFYACYSLPEIDIPEAVSTIGADAFGSCDSLKTIVIPEAVTAINSWTFYGCDSLTSVTIPNTVTTIGSYAFGYCSSLPEITIPDSVTSISDSTFRYCKSLTSITIPENIVTIGSEVFYGSGLETVYCYEGSPADDSSLYPDGVELVYIGTYTPSVLYTGSCGDDAVYSFYNNGSLVISGTGAMTDYSYNSTPWYSYRTDIKSLVIEEGITSTGSYGFYGCSALKEVTLPESLTAIGSDTFYNCSSLPNITIPEAVTYIGSYAFYSCSSLSEITIPEGVTKIYVYTFFGCSSLPEIIIPESVTSIESYAFSKCSSLSSVEFSESAAVTINSRAFYSCSALTEITLPLKTVIDAETVFESSGLKAVYCYENSPADDSSYYPSGTELVYIGNASEEVWVTGSCGDDAVYTLYGDGRLVISGSGDMYSYNSWSKAVPWYSYRGIIKSAVIEDGITSIGGYAFYYCQNMTEVSIADSVTSIGSDAFYYCKALQNPVLPSGLTTIGDSAFTHCSSITEINIPDSVTKITDGAFNSCTSLKEITIPSGVTSVNLSTFRNCSSLSKVTLLGSVTTIGNYAFYNCSSLPEIIIPNSVTSIGQYAFYGCSSLPEVNLPESVTSLGAYAFYGCSSIESFYAPENVSVDNSTAIEGFAEGATVYCYSNTAIYTYAVELGYNVYDLGEHEHEYESFSTTYSCTEQGYAGRTCWICGYTIIDEYFGGEGHQFGDWVVESEATVFSGGYKYRECSACGETEEVYTDKIAVDIETEEGYGLANFTVVDASTLEGISGVSMYITTENDGEGTVYFDSDGTASVILPVGKQTVTVSADGYASRSLKVTIVSGEQDIAKISLGTGSLVEGVLTVDPMTDEEIKDAGIDVDSEDNNQIYKYTVTFEFGEYEAYFDSDGKNYSTPQTFYDGGVPVKVTALSEKFYLVVTGEVKWLKEMFDVQLLVINNSATDTIENCTAELVIPEGLSLADMTEGEQSLAQTIDYVEEGGTDTIHWYVRGDEEGEYNITAKLDGQLMPFEEEFSYEYTTDEPVKVYAGSALQMTIKAPGATYYNDDYTVTLELENVSDKSIYNFTHTITSLEQFKAVTYSGGYIIEEAYVDTDTDKVTLTTYDEEGKIVNESETTVDAYVIGSATAEEFKPGDKLVIEVTSNIMFEGSRLTAKGAELVQQIEEAQKILDAYNAVTEGSEILNSAYNMLTAAQSNMSAAAVSDTKGEVYSSLSEAVTQLLEIISTGSSTALEMVSRLEKAGVYAALTEISQDSSYYENHTEDEINSTLKVMDAILRSCDDEEFETYSVFNILKAVAESIPVSFILEDVFVNTLEGSTTEIPCVIEITAGDYPVSYSVSAVGSYLYNILYTAMGSDVPRYVDIFSGNGSGCGDVVQHVIMTQNSTSTLAAESATGNAAFRAWVETADGSISSAFELTSDNETASVSGGVLSFTGSGFISAVPLSSEGGTLYVEMTENGETDVTSYAVDVVSAHTCSGEWVSVVEPAEDSDGYMVKVCDTCGDVIDIKTTSLCTTHSFGEYETISEASETEYGLKVRTCETCGYKQYSVIKTTNVLELTEDSEMTIDSEKGYVIGTEAEVLISEFMDNFENETIVIYDDEGVQITDLTGFIGTGFTVQNIYKNEVTDQLIVIIKGDINSDGSIDVLDLAKMFDYIQNVSSLNEYCLEASYINGDEAVDILDLAALFDKIQS